MLRQLGFVFIFDIAVVIIFSIIFNYAEQVAGTSMAPQAISGMLQNVFPSATTQVYQTKQMEFIVF